MTWLLGSASVIGSSHEVTGTPCQDAFDIERSADGKWLAVAVCDGAGSAKYAEAGSNLVAKTFAKKLILLSNEIANRQPGAWINDFVIQQVLNVRDELRAAASGDDLRDFHTTLVAFLMSDNGGFAIHIGDGSLLGGKVKVAKNNVTLDDEIFMSKPENGEYSNETFFITEGDWVKHLRIAPLPSLDWMLLGTDGGSSFYLDSANNPKQEFILSFIEHLTKCDGQDWNANIERILSDEQANRITNDDKTLIFFFRDHLIFDKKDRQFSFSKDPVVLMPKAQQRTEGTATNQPKASKPKETIKPKKNIKKWFLLSLLLLVIVSITFLAILYLDHDLYEAIGKFMKLDLKAPIGIST